MSFRHLLGCDTIAQQKALLKILIRAFLQKCILNTNAMFIDCAVETKCFRKNSVKKKFRQTAEFKLHISASEIDIEKRIREAL